MSEDLIMSKVILDISMSLDGLIAQPDDDPGPIQEFLFSGETEHDGSPTPSTRFTTRRLGANRRPCGPVRKRLSLTRTPIPCGTAPPE